MALIQLSADFANVLNILGEAIFDPFAKFIQIFWGDNGIGQFRVENNLSEFYKFLLLFGTKSSDYKLMISVGTIEYNFSKSRHFQKMIQHHQIDSNSVDLRNITIMNISMFVLE